MRKEKKDYWWQNPLRIAALQCESGEDAFDVLDKWEEMGFNTEQLLHVVGKGYRGFYIEKEHKDILEKYIDTAHKKGIRIILYVAPVYIGNLQKEHPEWVQFIVDNGQIKRGNSVCLNSSWRTWFFQEIKKMAKFDIDGLFIDGPYIPFNACYCENCKKKFVNETNFSSLPIEEDFLSPVWHTFIEFKCKSVANFVSDAKDALKSIRPDALFYCNASSGNRPLAITAQDNRLLIKHMDMLGAEGGFVFYTNPDKISLWKTAFTAKILESYSEGKPTVIFVAGDFKPWNRYVLPEGETQLMIADSVANGANIWYGIHFPYQCLNSPGGQAAKEIISLLKNNEPFYKNTHSIAEIGMLCSQSTLDWYVSESEETDFTRNLSRNVEGKFGNHTKSLNGFYEILLRCGIPFDVITEESILNDKIGKYKILILPTCACMSEKLSEKIRNYVSKGGFLIATFDSSLFDEYGKMRKNFALADIFGASYSDGFVKMNNSSYMKVKHFLPFLKGYEQNILPSTCNVIKVKANNANIHAVFLEPSIGQYQPLSSEMTPGLLENKFGKGKCLFVAGDLGETYKEFGIPVHRLIINNCIFNWITPQIHILPSSQLVSISVRKQVKMNRTLIHLVNYCGQMRRPIENVIPVKNFQIKVKTGKFKKVYTLVSKKKPQIQIAKHDLYITIPELNSYEVVVVEE